MMLVTGKSTQAKLWILFILLVLPKEAWMSRIHYQEITFAELVQMARPVVVVKKSTAAPRQKTVAVRKLTKSYPPFQFPVATYVVVKTLRGEGPAAGSEIEVYPADFDRRLDLHRRYVIDGMSKSPIYRTYKPTSYQPDDDVFILFLRNTADGHLSFFCLGSMEGMEYEARIVANENGK